MSTLTNAQVADRFAAIAQGFCSAVETAVKGDRTERLWELYALLPDLLSAAIRLPGVELNSDRDEMPGSRSRAVRNQEWKALHEGLREMLGDWDGYQSVFDPTKDDAAIYGSLADDLADIDSDLKKGLQVLHNDRQSPEEAIWTWRLLFYSHWGKHAINALSVIHARLSEAAF